MLQRRAGQASAAPEEAAHGYSSGGGATPQLPGLATRRSAPEGGAALRSSELWWVGCRLGNMQL